MFIILKSLIKANTIVAHFTSKWRFNLNRKVEAAKEIWRVQHPRQTFDVSNDTSLKCLETETIRQFHMKDAGTMGKFRLVLLSNPKGVQVKLVEKLDFKEIERTLRDEKIQGIVISKEQ